MVVSSPVYMVAAENGALPGAKAGGVGDVLRDLPPAVAASGRPVTILMPSYGRLHKLEGMTHCGEFPVRFAGETRLVSWYGQQTSPDVDTVVLHDKRFDPHDTGSIYYDDGPHAPFATDAGKFALLSAAAGQWLVQHASEGGVLHLHDWHAAPLALLRARDPDYQALQQFRCVLTIHNLALQGLRPRRDHGSSFEAWFPQLDADDALLDDPRYPDVANPLAAAIRLCDHINTVSPTNAQEILQPNDEARGFHGGEGLEALLMQASAEGRLHGILNGCDYSGSYTRVTFAGLRAIIEDCLTGWKSGQPHNAALFEQARRNLHRAHPSPDIIVTAVSRLTDQKAGLLLTESEGSTLLQKLLRTLPGNAVLILLGSGDPGIEAALAAHASTDPRLVFLRGFSEPLADAVFAGGDLFLMPSTFEPCGISQMFAMRAGQPCLVHAVGGLNDTVQHRVTGFSFRGATREQQIQGCVDALIEAQQVFFDAEPEWQAMVSAASQQRFLWADSAQHYGELMYD